MDISKLQMNTETDSSSNTVSNNTVSNNKENLYRENFYLGVNGDWLADPKNDIPSEYSRWGGFIKLHDDSIKSQIKLVDEIIKKIEEGKDVTDSERKIGAIWMASNARFKSWDENTATYEPIISELRNISILLKEFSPENLANYFHYTYTNGISNVFVFDKESDFNNTNNVVLDLKAEGMTLPSREYYLDDKFKEKRELYLQHLNNVKNIINRSLPEDSDLRLGDNFAQDVLSFETDIAKLTMTSSQYRKFTEYYTDTTLTDLTTDSINNLRYLEEKENNYEEADRKFRLNDAMLEKVKLFWNTVFEKFDFRRVLKENREKFYKNTNANINTNINANTNTYEIKSDAPGVEQLYCYDGDSFRRTLNLILDESNFGRYLEYMKYSIISSNKAFTTKEMDDEFFDFFSRKMKGIEERPERDKININIINTFAGDLMGEVYVKKYFPSDKKDSIKNLINTIIETMGDSIKSNDWYEEVTKEKALTKLSMFNVKVGYPDVMKDYSDLLINPGDSIHEIYKKVELWAMKHEFYDRINAPKNKDEWLMCPQVVNAYFHPLHNEIVFPAAILQPPYFNTEQGDIDFEYLNEYSDSKLEDTINMDLVLHAANCGGICAVIAHEITHGYDDNGRQFDGHGNQVDWWTERDADIFNEKAKIVKKQAASYSVTINGETYNQNPDLTIGENLADLGGLSIGLKALNKQLVKNNIQPNSLMMQFYHRVFFKSYANIWKQKTKPDTEIQLITTDSHAPTSFRANLVSNIDEFYDAFNVVEGDGMFLEKADRLVMW